MRGKAKQKLGLFDAAKKDYDEALKQSNCIDYLCAKASVYYDMKNYKKTASLLTKIIWPVILESCSNLDISYIEPNVKLAYGRLGIMKFLAGETEKAINDMMQFMMLEPQSHLEYFYQYTLYYFAEDLTEKGKISDELMNKYAFVL